MKRRFLSCVGFLSALLTLGLLGTGRVWAADGTLTGYTTGLWMDTAQWQNGVVAQGAGAYASITPGYAAEAAEGCTFQIPDAGLTLGGIKYLGGEPVVQTRISGGTLTFDNAGNLASAVGRSTDANALILLAPLAGPGDILLENCLLAAPAHHAGDTVINSQAALYGLSYAEQICGAVTNQLPPTRFFLNSASVTAYAHSSWEAFDADFALVAGSRLATCTTAISQKGLGALVTGTGVPAGAFFKSQLTGTIFELNGPATQTGTFTLHVDGVAAGQTSYQRFTSLGTFGTSIADIWDLNNSHLLWDVGELTGSGMLRKRGSGTLAIGVGTNFTDTLSLENGRLVVRPCGDTQPSIHSFFARGGTLEVPTNTTFTVRGLTLEGSVTKTGAGTFAANSIGGSGDVRALTVQEGRVELGGRCPIADAWFHVDASDAASFVTVAENGTNFVTRWNDTDGGTVHATSATRPYLVTNSLAGKPVVDFGSFLFPDGGGAFAQGYGASMAWSATDTTIREVFMVYADCEGLNGNFLLGDDSGFDFHRGGNGMMFLPDVASGAILNGLVEVDGVPVAANSSLPAGFHLIHLRTTGNVRANAFGRSRNVCWGGQLYAEVIVFNRTLADGEVAQVNDYLNGKWFGGAGAYAITDLTVAGNGTLTVDADEVLNVGTLVISGRVVKRGSGALRVNAITKTGDAELIVEEGAFGVGTNTTQQVDAVDVSAGAGLDAGAGSTLSVGNVTGDGTLVKTGAGTVVVGAASSGVDALDVRAGMLTVRTPSVPDGAFFHVDASDSSSLVTVAENGTNFVTRWNDTDGGAVYATAATRPYLVPNALAGKPVVDFGSFLFPAGGGVFAQGYGASMDWSETDTAIREVFLVYADCTGLTGNFILGDTDAYDFHRGANCALLDSNNAKAELRNGLVEVDGVVRPSDYSLPAGFHLIHFRSTGDVRANAFARSRQLCWGGQLLAEMIVYNRVLSDDEAAQTSAYLTGKWFGGTGSSASQGGAVAFEAIAVAADAALNLVGGAAVTVGTLTCGGTITAATLVPSELMLTSDGTSVSALTFNGTFTIPAAGQVTVSGAPLPRTPADYVVATAQGCDGAANLASWRVVGTGLPSGRKAHLAWQDGQLVLRILPSGVNIVLR